MKRVQIVLVIAILLAAGAALALLRAKASPGDEAALAGPSPNANVVTSHVRFGTFLQRVAAHGRIGPPSGSDAKLAFAGSGVLQRIDVVVGETVVAGEPLAEYAGANIAASALNAARARAEATRSHLLALKSGNGSAQSDKTGAQTALRQSQAKVALDERTLARQRELYRGGVVAEKDVETAVEQLALDRAEQRANQAKLDATSAGVGDALTQAQADYASALSDTAVAGKNLENTSLRAPSDGVVMAILKHVGEGVDPTTPVIEIGPAASRTLTLSVPGSLGRPVRVGDSVDFVVAHRAVGAHGHVVGVVPNVDPATQATTVQVDGVPAGVVSGDAVDATIVIGQERGVIVPTSAIVQDPQSGNTLVFVRDRQQDGSFAFSARTVALMDGDDRWTVVAHGLHGDETVATQAAFDLLAPSGS